MKVLVVDDDAIERKNIISVLDNVINISIMEADTKFIAQNLIGKLNPDVSIVDLNIGGNLHGIQLLEKMKDNNPNTKIILLVSEFTPDEFHISEDLGVDGYIFKDMEVEDIKYIFDLMKVKDNNSKPLVIGYLSN